MAFTSHICLKTLGFQQCLVDACVFRLVEEGRIVITVVVTPMVSLLSSWRVDVMHFDTSCQERGGTEMVWRFPLQTGTGDGYSDHIP